MRTSFVISIGFGFLLMSGTAAAATVAQPPAPSPLTPIDFGAYHVDRDKGDLPLEKGRAFMADLKTRDAEVWASVTEAARFQIQTDETEKFTRQKGYVIWAYSALWAILIGFAIRMYVWQRKISAELTRLEAKVAVEKA